LVLIYLPGSSIKRQMAQENVAKPSNEEIDPDDPKYDCNTDVESTGKPSLPKQVKLYLLSVQMNK
jgi:hypothetical protein